MIVINRYDSCFPDSIESLLKPRNSLSEEPGTIFLEVEPVFGRSCSTTIL